MSNPFESSDDGFLVLVNEEDQRSLWPASLAVPAGWSVAREESTRAVCLEFVERTWTDMRPRSARR
ncbi:MbtH family protein [Streptomyces sp. NPDC046161]|uniref:MbtH family protein n=1 Tax=Streptomyces sp. NPDC046161 TaxID=3155132 RepID=UPI0033EADC9D